MAGIDYAHRAAEIVRDAGGQIVGRTRLQKIAFILEVAGLGGGFPFRYKHYGPFSELLAGATQHAAALRLLNEDAGVAAWGGSYSTYPSNLPPPTMPNYTRQYLAKQMAGADAVELELAATALYLYLYEGNRFDPWAETQRRKPDKAANDRLEQAKQLYHRLQQVTTVPRPLPHI